MRSTHWRTMKLFSRGRRSCALGFLLLCVASSALAQDSSTPQRGFQPAGSYALTDLETINTTNGNMLLSIPMAALPPGRGNSPGAGDWDGNGSTTIGLFRPGSNNYFYLSNNFANGNVDLSIPFGAPNDLPIVGDWDGNGTVTMGLYRPSNSTFFLRNSNSVGNPDIIFPYGDGPNGDKPVAGDWDGM